MTASGAASASISGSRSRRNWRSTSSFASTDYDLAGLLSAVERGQVDAAIAAIPISVDGESRFDFSHSYFGAALGIAVRTEPPRGMLTVVRDRLNTQFFTAVAGLVGLLLVVGTVMWLVERRTNAQHFDPHPARGIGDGLWWAAVTMTTTGYGDKVPASWRGRTVGLLWMFTSIFLVALFSATMASSFVVNRLKTGITSPADLPRVRVAAVAGSTGEQWLATQGLQTRTYPFVIQASKALQRGDVQALIYERAIIGHMVKQYGWRQIDILPHTLVVRDYAIALPPGSAMKEPINRALLKVVQHPDWHATVQHYVGNADPVAASNTP